MRLLYFIVGLALTSPDCYGFPPPLKRVRALLIADTFAENVGPATKVSIELVETALREIFENDQYPRLKGRLKIDYLGIKRSVTPEQITTYYQTNPIDSDEVAFFFYAGHGAWDPKKGHWLAMSGGELTRRALHRILNQTGASFQIILTNACSNFARTAAPAPAPPVDPNETVRLTESQRKLYQDYYENLFFQHRGRTDITATQPGDLAWGYVFGLSVAQVLASPASMRDRDGDGFMHWADITTDIRDRTNDIFLDARSGADKDERIKSAKRQKPFALAMGTVQSASITSMYLEENAVKGDFKGLGVHFEWEARGWRGHELFINTYFIDDQGNYLMDRDNQFRSSTGRVVLQRSIVPERDNQNGGWGHYFIPWSQLDVSMDTLREKPHAAVVEIWHKGKFVNRSLYFNFGGNG